MKGFILGSLAMGLGLVNAQVLFCDANRRPAWEDCASVMDYFAMEGSTEIAHINGELGAMPTCMHWWWEDGNCCIGHCFQEEPNDGEGDPRSITLGQVHQLYVPIEERCSLIRAGGEFTGAFEFVDVYNQQDYCRASAVMEKAVQLPSGMMRAQTPLEDYLQWLNDTASDNDDVAEEALTQRNVPSHELAKRQHEDDDYIQFLFTALGIRHPTDWSRGPRVPSGEYTYEVSESQTYSVTTSVSMGAAWDVFSASIGTDIEESESFTVTEGISINVDCEDQAQITFYPLYDYYEIMSWPSETTIEIWVPAISGARLIYGEIDYQCLG